MITIVILLILAWTFYIGYARGLVLQLFYSGSAIVSMIVAAHFYKNLSTVLSLWIPYANATQGSVTYFYPNSQLFDLDKVFYAGLAYFIVFSVVYCLARFLGIFVHLAPLWKLNQPWMKILSGLLAMGVTIFVLQMGLTILSTVPIAFIQNHLQGNMLLRFLISHTPMTTQLLKYLWVTKIIG